MVIGWVSSRLLFLQNWRSVNCREASSFRTGPKFSGVFNASGFVWTDNCPDLRRRWKTDYQCADRWGSNRSSSYLDESAVAGGLVSGLSDDSTNSSSVDGTYSVGANTIEPLCPPKPKEFDIDGPGSQSWGLPVTRLNSAISGSGVVKPEVGGICL